MADGAAASLRTLRDDALTMLVLWATTQEYSAVRSTTQMLRLLSSPGFQAH
jgi:hypothetical protein